MRPACWSRTRGCSRSQPLPSVFPITATMSRAATRRRDQFFKAGDVARAATWDTDDVDVMHVRLSFGGQVAETPRRASSTKD